MVIIWSTKLGYLPKSMTFRAHKKDESEKKTSNISLLRLKIVILPRILHSKKEKNIQL
jgi:hypothetical protein